MIGLAVAVTEEDHDLAGVIQGAQVFLKKAGENRGQGTGRRLCIKRHAVIATRVVKFLFAPHKGSPSIVTIVLEASEGKARKDS